MLRADASSESLMKVRWATEGAEKRSARLKRASRCHRAATADIKMSLNKKSSKNDFLEMGPSAMLRTFREAALPQLKLNRYFRTSSQDLALTGMRKCFPRFASIVR